MLAACDFCTYELRTPYGFLRRHILFFEDITTREVWCGGIVGDPGKKINDNADIAKFVLHTNISNITYPNKIRFGLFKLLFEAMRTSITADGFARLWDFSLPDFG